MSLHGSLETFALADVLALLGNTAKTGELHVIGGRIEGRLWLDSGLVVEAGVGQAPTLVDALFDLLRLTGGSFSFDPEIRAAHPGTPMPIEPLLAGAQARLEEWREIEQAVPSLEATVRLVPELSRERIALRDDQWRLVVCIAAHRTVGDVVVVSGESEFNACKTMKELVDLGLLLVEAVAEPALAPEPSPEPAPEAEPAPAAAAMSEPGPSPPEPDEAVDVVPQEQPDREPVRLEALLTGPGEREASPIPASLGDEADEADLGPAAPQRTVSAKPGRQPNQAAPAAAQAGAEDEGPSRAMAQALVRQLASLDEPDEAPKSRGGRKARASESAPARSRAAKADDLVVEPVDAMAPGPHAPAEAATPVGNAGAKPPAADADAAEAPEEASEDGSETEVEEPINRGLLLKFLSSVRT